MSIPIILKFESTYLEWQKILLNFPKPFKYGIGNSLDIHLLSSLENLYLCLQEDNTERKLVYLKKANAEIDIVKFLLNICFKNQCISDKQLEILSQQLLEIGRIIGGWKKALTDKLSKPKNVQ